MDQLCPIKHLTLRFRLAFPHLSRTRAADNRLPSILSFIYSLIHFIDKSSLTSNKMPISSGFSQDLNPDYYARHTRRLPLRHIIFPFVHLDSQTCQERALGRNHLPQKRRSLRTTSRGIIFSSLSFTFSSSLLTVERSFNGRLSKRPSFCPIVNPHLSLQHEICTQ